jgi:hypothetical protein
VREILLVYISRASPDCEDPEGIWILDGRAHIGENNTAEEKADAEMHPERSTTATLAGMR